MPVAPRIANGTKPRVEQHEALVSMDINIRCEVLHLFTHVLGADARTHLSSPCGAQGIIPDYAIMLANKVALYDMKGIGLCRSKYTSTSLLRPTSRYQYAVNARAASVPGEYKRKASSLDQELHGTAANATGQCDNNLETLVA